MIAIFLNGRADIWEKETAEAYTVAEAAMKSMFPRTYVFNPCTFLNKYKGGDRMRKKEKILKTLRMGFFSHMVLLDDWWLWASSRHGVEELANGWAPGCGRDKPIVITMTYEMELQGRDYLSRLARAEHQCRINQ